MIGRLLDSPWLGVVVGVGWLGGFCFGYGVGYLVAAL